MTNMGNLWPIEFAAVILVILTVLSFPGSAFVTSAGTFYLEGTEKVSDFIRVANVF